MKGFTVFNVVLLLVGIVLIYSGVQGASPVDVFRNALKGKGTPKIVQGAMSSFDPNNTAGSGGGGGGGGGGSW